LLIAASGCTAAVRTSSGGATSRPGVEGSRTTSIVIGDRGGPLTRAALIALGIAGAAGSVEDTKTTTEVTTSGNDTIIHRTTTGELNQRTLQSSTDMINTATNLDANISGIATSLEIASPSLGGDTGGWLFNMGYSGRWGHRRGLGARLFAGIGFGQLTHYNRKIRRYTPMPDPTAPITGPGAIVETMEDSDYIYAGTPIRIALTYAALVEAYVQADLNWITPFHEVEVINSAVSDAPVPSPWTFGVRATYLVGFVGTFVSLASMRPEGRSYGFEAGIDF
jgi:hypothetical protein